MDNIKLNINNSIARITLSKPPLNILGIEELRQLAEIFKTLKTTPDLKIITIESSEKVFSAGVDISDHNSENARKMLEAFHNIFLEMFDLDIPTIALVNSACIGGGAELALFCDFVLASENAYFSLPEIKAGCFPPVAMVYLPYITGNKKALELILTGEKVYAHEAAKLGLINKVISGDEADEFINLIAFNRSDVIKTTLLAFKRLNYPELKEKLKLAEKIYLEEIDHDKIKLKI